MNSATARRLADLNRRFYAEHAVAFAHRRATPQPGILRLLAQIQSGAHVLEIGCGDGKVARALIANSNVASYLGLDLDPTLLDRAQRGVASGEWPVAASPHVTRHSPPVTFSQCDLTSPAWDRVLPPHPFDWILAFSVFHHLPGFISRAQILHTLASHLAPHGTLAMSNWQFTRSERLRSHIVPWPEIGLTDADVEPNDFLLPWERSGRRGRRYVHLLDEAEARRLAEAAGLAVIDVFQSDGVSGDLADYVRMRKGE